ncbi:MAG: Stp1/IreP family PP2C-type Ser/Thr phosphatase [Firmicutes bacterium]|nr:Stp1/IreP family PP2C-type Ser/Thr phosphatase [Bacillota bacterium]
MKIGVSSDVGKIRDINQDSYFCSNIEALPLFAVADGMGGHNAGEIASSLAIDIIKKYLYDNKEDLINGLITTPKFINDSLNKANEAILAHSLNNEKCNGMGTTITMVYLTKEEIFVGHVGDSRAYLLREKSLKQLTHDHSLVAELVRNGSITEEEAINHPQKNIITRALGTDKDLKVDILSREIKEDDIIMLCTDGLTNMVSDKEITEIILKNKNIEKASKALTTTANRLGGSDNTTVMLIKIK